MSRRYAVLDVFTDTPLAGNPLAVVLDSEGLDSARMQAIAAEFNLSETVFVLPPERPGVTARVRIFTPTRELSFAGHPTVGTAILLASQRFGEVTRETDSVVVLDEEIGPVRCGVVLEPGRPGRAVFDLPRLPREIAFTGDTGLVASALGVDRSDIGFENHLLTVFEVGPRFVYVPLRDAAAIGAITVDPLVWGDAFGSADANVFAYTRECVTHDGAFHARMFAPGLGILEDPATGSAVAAFAGVIRQFDAGPDGEQRYIIEQGYEMGRPSRIELEMLVEAGQLAGGRIGGAAVRIAAGTLEL